MKERFNIAACAGAAVADIGTSLAGFAMGFPEYGGSSWLVESGHVQNAVIFRMAVTAVLIGGYALTRGKEDGLNFTFDKAIRITNVIAWGTAALNALRIAGVIH